MSSTEKQSAVSETKSRGKQAFVTKSTRFRASKRSALAGGLGNGRKTLPRMAEHWQRLEAPLRAAAKRQRPQNWKAAPIDFGRDRNSTFFNFEKQVTATLALAQTSRGSLDK